MKFMIKGKEICTFRWKRLLNTICFLFFAIIWQRTRTASGLDGALETFRDLQGVLIGLMILSHYHKDDFRKNRILLSIWTVVAAVGGILFYLLGKDLFYFENDRIALSFSFLFMGWAAICTLVALKEGYRPTLNKKMLVLWAIMMALMLVSRSDYLWPWAYAVLFGIFYLTDFTLEEREDIYQGLLNGTILSFFVFQGYCCVFRPYDMIRYVGIFTNSNNNAVYYLVVLAAVFAKLWSITRPEVHWLVRAFLWLTVGAVYAFTFMTIGRMAWGVSFLMGIFFLIFYRDCKGRKRFIRGGLTIILCSVLMFPVCFAATRYIPPLFHHVVWFFGEWSESKVHSWDPWNSEKYIEMNDVLEEAFGRVMETLEEIVKADPLVMRARASELPEEDPRIAAAVIRGADESDGLLVRKTIYRIYFSRLNLMGHSQADQGFQLMKHYWCGHAHDIYLQYGTDFGVLMLLCFIALNGMTVVVLLKRSVKNGPHPSAGWILFLFPPLVFGAIEYAWGSGAMTIVILFLAWWVAMREE